MTKMIVPFFDLGALARNEAEEVHACIDEVLTSGQFIGGELVERFEIEFAQFIGVNEMVGVGNGLDAIRLALEANRIGIGDEVIVPAFTYYATWLGVMQTGARPVPVDVDHATANIDPHLVEQSITERTRAILAVHLYGQAADLLALRRIADRHDILLFEDAAQSHGAQSTAGMSGSVGDASAFSFYPTKNLGAFGDAGAVATNDPDIAARVRSRRSYGQGTTKYHHVDTGWNSRLDPIQAAILLLHLEKLPQWTDRRRAIATSYRGALSNASASSVLGPVDSLSSVWHHFVVRSTRREEFQDFLRDRGVGTDVHYPYSIMTVQPAVDALRPEDREAHFPVSQTLSEQVVSLPMGPWMTDAQVEHVTTILSEVPRDLLAI
ncbi:MAG: DegT/DnrJ/EryC1/StrS family aminotransferase [Cryobacterium sp.]|nr:DegT/DnrJ/EryC1/StrS family aminotransferase [Cryobacterium sp.]